MIVVLMYMFCICFMLWLFLFALKHFRVHVKKTKSAKTAGVSHLFNDRSAELITYLTILCEATERRHATEAAAGTKRSIDAEQMHNGRLLH